MTTPLLLSTCALGGIAIGYVGRNGKLRYVVVASALFGAVAVVVFKMTGLA